MVLNKSLRHIEFTKSVIKIGTRNIKLRSMELRCRKGIC